MAGASQGGGQTAQPQNVFQQSQQGLTAAGQQAMQGMQYQPQQVRTQQMGAADVQPFMNPYTRNVIDQSMADLERQRQMQQNVTGAQAGAAGAFGGSRHGVAESLTNEAFARQGGQLAANLRQQGFTQAQNMAQNLQQQNVQNQMQAALANQAAGLTGAQQRLSAGGQLGRLAQTGFNMGQDVQQGLMQTGNQQQLMNQALIDAAKGQYGGYTGSPASTIGFLSQALGVSPVPQTTTASRQPGLFDYLTLGATAFGGRGR